MRLIERTGPLEELGRYRDDAKRGQGRMIFVGGEAGVGKTTLVEELARVSAGMRVWCGACDAMATPRPLGPLFDIAAVTHGHLERLLRESAPPDEIFSALLDDLTTTRQPTLIVIEDAHWADAATLDLLRFLGRRIGTARALLVVTYRNDEVTARHPLRTVLGNLATAAAVKRLAIDGLSAAGVRALCGDKPIDAEALHRRTRGNPFFSSRRSPQAPHRCRTPCAMQCSPARHGSTIKRDTRSKRRRSSDRASMRSCSSISSVKASMSTRASRPACSPARAAR